MRLPSFFKTRKFCVYIWVAFIVLWTAFIFAHSLMDAEKSGGQSARLLEFIENLGRLLYPEFELSHNFLRKCAHFFEYFMLGAIWSQGLWIFEKRRKILSREILLSGVLTALVDETLQLFSKGRSGSVSDVWLDYSAFVVSFLIFCLIFFAKYNKKRKKF